MLDDSRNDLAKVRPLSRSDDGSIKAIRWVFPIHGIPEVRSKESKGKKRDSSVTKKNCSFWFKVTNWVIRVNYGGYYV